MHVDTKVAIGGGDEGGHRGGSHSRPNVHTATQRSGSASFFKKSSGTTEY